MLTRDYYVALLEKRAADAAESTAPATDSVEFTKAQFDNNREDHREYLHSIFPNAGEVQSNQTATVKKLFNNIPSGAIVGTPLLKVASREVFFTALEQQQTKIASALYQECCYRAFCDEIEKIAALKPQTLSQVAMKNQVAMSRPAKAWDISNPISAGASAAKAAPQGSGTSVHTNGILSRVFGR